jgi:multidrug efflux pump subunit AcrB
MLPLDNKSEFSILVDMQDGTALTQTTTLLDKIARKIRNIPEVKDLQIYSGTAKPFDFNGLVRHYYLRKISSQGGINIQLNDVRERSSHEIALLARKLVQFMAQEVNAKITIVEMPPGPPVLRAVVAEVYGANDGVRKKLARDLTQIFEQSNAMTDVDNLMRDNHPIWHFKVNRRKATQYGVSVANVQKTMAMIMQPWTISTIRQKNALEPTPIVLKIPLSIRSQLNYLKQFPIASKFGGFVPLSEVGKFILRKQDDYIFRKDLVDLEYVVGEPIGRLSAPIYAMNAVDDLLGKYKTIDGKKISGEFWGRDKELQDTASFVWAGEWTVTYETFRDMGIAFMVALVMIYMLVVWQFGNFLIPAIIMTPIPLTLLGIVPGHWLLSAEFTATSMIGWIALAGIIVRNSILLIDFIVQEYAQGVDYKSAVINSCTTRTRPILITAFALIGGSSVILFDPIFQGMAVSLLFGVFVATILTLFVVPLGVLSAGERSVFNMAQHLGVISENKKFIPIVASVTEATKEVTTDKNNNNKDIKPTLEVVEDTQRLNINDFLEKEDKSN